MGKLTIEQLAGALVEKNGLSKQEAQSFINAFFDVIRTGIDKERLVKVKGLGTFKVIDVEARESVNVNTGERVLIDSHSKISFTPDSMMKELVNKPFSEFETVILNEGVEFDDMPSSADSEALSAADNDVVDDQQVSDMVEFVDIDEPRTETVPEQELVQEQEHVQEQELAQEQEPVQEQEPIQEQELEDEAVAIQEPDMDAEVEPVPNPEPETVPVPEYSHRQPWLLIFISLLAGFGLGYIAHDIVPSLLRTADDTSVEIKQETTVADVAPVDSLVGLADSTALAVESADSIKKAEEMNEKAVAKPEVNEQPDYMKYELQDSRIRHGAYYIIGTASVQKAREGDNSERISRRYLGKGMSCYVEVYNGITSSTPLQAGQEIKIPKLITKKAMKAKLERQQKKK